MNWSSEASDVNVPSWAASLIATLTHSPMLYSGLGLFACLGRNALDCGARYHRTSQNYAPNSLSKLSIFYQRSSLEMYGTADDRPYGTSHRLLGLSLAIALRIIEFCLNTQQRGNSLIDENSLLIPPDSCIYSYNSTMSLIGVIDHLSLNTSFMTL